MKKLDIEFIDNYYSFKKGEKLSFDGDFIILSGLNGTGKTQLLNAMAKPYENHIGGQELSRKYITIIKQDDEIIDNTEIRLLNFSENLKYKNQIKNLNAQDINNKIELIFRIYSNIIQIRKSDYLKPLYDFKSNDLKKAAYLHYNHNLEDAPLDNWEEILNFVESIKKTFPEEKWYSLNKDEIKTILSSIDFKWITGSGRPETKLLEHIAYAFLTYAKKMYIAKDECINHVNEDLNHNKFDDDEWKKNAPWTRLNDLFNKLNFHYQFLEDYHINLNDGGLDEQIILKDKNNNENRRLNDLSDGEKTLLDLALHSFDFDEQKVKLVLFDEYDAFLNSSMIDKIKIILDEFYKNVQIVFITHILTTMYQLKDDSKKFYELFFKDNHHDVNDISNLVSFSDIEHFLKLLKLDDRLEFGKCKLCIVSEGRDNKKHIDHVLKNIYDIENKNDILVWNGGGCTEFFTHYDIYKQFGKKIMFVWDSDVKDEIINSEFKKNAVDVDNSKIFKYKFQKNNDNPFMETGIENLYNSHDIKKLLPRCINNGNPAKNTLADSINEITDKEVFKNFEPFVEEVKKILQTN